MALPDFLINLWDRLNDLYAKVCPRISVEDADFLYRRIHPKQIENGEFTSSAFDDQEMSADIASLTAAEKSYARWNSEEFGLVRISVRDLRQLSLPQEVKHWPTVVNWSHGLAIGEKSRSIRRQIKKKAEWAIKPKSLRDDSTDSATQSFDLFP